MVLLSNGLKGQLHQLLGSAGQTGITWSKKSLHQTLAQPGAEASMQARSCAHTSWLLGLLKRANC